MPSPDAVLTVAKASVHNFMIVREGQNSIKIIVNFLIGPKDYEGETNLTDSQCRGLAEELIAISGRSNETQVALDDSGKPRSITLKSHSLSFGRCLRIP